MSRKRCHSSEMGRDPKYARRLIAQGKYFAAVLYERAIDNADDWGRMLGDAEQFILTVLPTCAESEETIEAALQDIAEAGLWERYQIDGKWYIQFPIAAFHAFQSYISEERRKVDLSHFPPPLGFPLPRGERKQGRRTDLEKKAELHATSSAEKLEEVTSSEARVLKHKHKPNPKHKEQNNRGESEGGAATYSVVADPVPFPQQSSLTDSLLDLIGCVGLDHERHFRTLIVRNLDIPRRLLVEMTEDWCATESIRAADWPHRYNSYNKRLTALREKHEAAENVARNNRIPNIGPSQEDLDWAAQLNADALARAPENKRRHEEQLRARRIG